MKLPTYSTPPNFTCPECGELADIVGDDNSFDFSGTHCTHGQSGTHYPEGWGAPICSCCEAPLEASLEEDPYDF